MDEVGVDWHSTAGHWLSAAQRSGVPGTPLDGLPPSQRSLRVESLAEKTTYARGPPEVAPVGVAVDLRPRPLLC